MVTRGLLACIALACAARSSALVRAPAAARSAVPAAARPPALGAGAGARRAGAPLLSRRGASALGALMAARAGERRPEAGDGDGGKKNDNPFLLRLLLLAATSSAAMLARVVRPLARALQAVDALLRPATPRGGLAGRLGRVVSALASLTLVSLISRGLGGRSASSSAPVELAYSEFLKLVDAGAGVGGIQVSPRRLDFLLDGQAHFARPVLATASLLDFLVRKGVEFRAPAPSALEGAIRLLVPLVWLGGVAFFYTRQARQMSGGVGKRARKPSGAESLSFDDVQGISKAKGEVVEIVTMLKNQKQYVAAGVRLPSGILLAGPPGTGKTLLARVLASEAGVPFFSCSGSDFVEIYVGRGASRIRSLFQKAQKLAPCVIFIDELDALGKRRSLRLAGSNDEAEQTLNQLLACMDGVDSTNNGVVVVGATNRAPLLDPALIRPGRFDRIVQLELPDAQGRADILGVHARGMQLDADVNLGRVAEMGTGMAGAELASICNEAAIRMVRRGGTQICQADFELAMRDYVKSRQLGPTSLIDKLLLGQS